MYITVAALSVIYTVMIDITPFSRCPYRTPQVVSEAVAHLLRGKTVCELGCAEGDNLVFMKRYASSVFGIEIDPKRYRIAEQRGLKISVTDYRTSPIPLADVYYFWPNEAERDTEFLMYKILANNAFKGIILIGGDTGYSPEPPVVKRCAKLGQLMEIPFNEGPKKRQSGIFLLAIVDANEARKRIVQGV